MQTNLPITSQTTMKAVLAAYQGAQDALFERFHIGGCATCGYEPEETVAAVAQRKQLNLDDLLETIRTSKPAAPKKYAGKGIPLTASPANRGPMEDADAVGTVGNASCGEAMTMWLHFKNDHGRKTIDRASFESFGCETAISLASRATDMLRGKTVEEALQLSGEEFAGDLGPLPPIKVHCGQLVEGALRAALTTPRDAGAPKPPATH
jgi:nitrogen fixation protein NifU and related proteins